MRFLPFCKIRDRYRTLTHLEIAAGTMVGTNTRNNELKTRFVSGMGQVDRANTTE